ncbi:MAG: HNH endonuclease [Planctomycetaceae bacterium]|nr:HNH endonuclease [Planctomycetaceae bacterium]
MPRQSWSRDETLVAFNIYCRTPFGRLHGKNPEIIEVAARLGRTASALAMKCCNLAAFDDVLKERGIKGLSKASKTDAEVWHDFQQHPEEVAFDSEQAFAQLMGQPIRAEDEVRWEDVQGLDRQAVTKVRVNQQFFRSLILSGYRNRCAVCELPLPQLLVASHIIPWSIDKTLRMNPQNGICLCALHDRAFDKGVLRIAPDYLISISAIVLKAEPVRSIADSLIRFDGKSLALPDRWHPNPVLLKRCVSLFTDHSTRTA